MTNLQLDTISDADRQAIRGQLDRILTSGPFRQSHRRQRFLEYVVSEALAGRSSRLKAYTVALEVFERPSSFDPAIDPLVRIEAARLRDKLREYYQADGRDDPIRIELPKGTYAPLIERRDLDSANRTTRPLADEEFRPPILATDSTRNDITHPSSEDDARTSTLLQDVKPGKRNLIRWAIAATILILIIAAGFLSLKGRSIRVAMPDKPSITVLPFNNIGDDPKWRRLADGITEDIITDLSHAKDLIVIARSSSEVYRDKRIDVRQIGSELNVKYILEGSIQSMGERIRVTAQLIDSTTGTHVWSERYDRPVDDLFAVQNDVTQSIAATLSGYEGVVADAERRLVRRKPPANLTAFDTYLLAMEAKHKVTKESLFEAERLFNKALELDPQLARAYVGLVDTQFYLIDLGLAPSVDAAVTKMMTAAQKAVELDPDDGKTHGALGTALLYQGKSAQAAIEFARAESLAPSDADMLLVIAWSIAPLGQSQRAVTLAERSLKLNPHYPDWYNQGLSYVFFFGEQYDRAVKYRLLVKTPLAIDYAYLAVSYAYLDRTDDARSAAENVKKLDPNWIAERYLSEGGGYPEKEAELFMEGARKAGLVACIPAIKLKDVPNLIHVKSCDRDRAKAPI